MGGLKQNAKRIPLSIDGSITPRKHREYPRWQQFRESQNVEDDFPVGMQGAVGLGLGTIVILGLMGWALGIDPSVLIGGAEVLNGGAPNVPSKPWKRARGAER
jgi:predicted metalloprotease